MKWEGGRESDNLEDRRKMAPKTMAIGGGGLIILIIGLLLGFDPNQIQKLLNNQQQGGAPGNVAVDETESPEEARSRKFAATILGYTEDVWGELFRKAGEQYEPPRMVLFSRQVETRCGVAPSAVGPFYCPADRTVYLDPTFFAELSDRLGGSAAEFSQAYVITHEVGHHVQNLLGYSRIVDEKRQTSSKTEANRWSVRLELQADYLAGVWAHYGQQKFRFIENGDIESAIQSANAIGDDRLQKQATGFTSPEKYTHGTSAQRVKWFRRGFETGDLNKLKELFELDDNDL
ncbi:KPN_02809 family neutral zinc metallopeptidase [Schlesneria paludicola]|uniref:KPN_02809 family neutral zinc metallopeptidase n=1 Tax=Schlesneria paludicola TaxID=360056 RepID=UPI00029B4D65|nr:neutral zinc metallopeptidase [Schlesneria paludicola]